MKTNSTSSDIIRMVCPVCYNTKIFSKGKGVPDCCNCCGALWGDNDSLSIDEIIEFHRQWCERMLAGYIENATKDAAMEIAKILMRVKAPYPHSLHPNIFWFLRRKLEQERNNGVEAP